MLQGSKREPRACLRKGLLCERTLACLRARLSVFGMAMEVTNKAAAVAVMSSLAYSFCSVSMVMSNKASGVCALSAACGS